MLSRLLSLLLTAAISAISVFAQTSTTEELRFSTTGVWGADQKAYLAQKPKLLTDWRKFVKLPAPPSNTSEVVGAELHELLRFQVERDKSDVARIVSERTQSGFDFGEFKQKTLATDWPATKALLDLLNAEANPIIFGAKKQFDRVRPTVLDPTLKPCIIVPPHPSYPSGHAAQAYLYAHVLTDVNFSGLETYFHRASEIAIGREIAGVHFNSDTKAGKLLADQIYAELQKHDRYKELVAAAKAEHSAKKK